MERLGEQCSHRNDTCKNTQEQEAHLGHLGFVIFHATVHSLVQIISESVKTERRVLDGWMRLSWVNAELSSVEEPVGAEGQRDH